MAAAAQNVPAKAAMGVIEEACAPMLGGGQGHVNLRQARGLPPLQRNNTGKSQILNQVFDAPGHDGDGGPAGQPAGMFGDFAERWPVEMVHVGVGEQDGVDRGQALDRNSRAAQTAKYYQPTGEYGIDQHSLAGDLNEKRRMTNESHAQFAGFRQGRQPASPR